MLGRRYLIIVEEVGLVAVHRFEVRGPAEPGLEPDLGIVGSIAMP